MHVAMEGAGRHALHRGIAGSNALRWGHCAHGKKRLTDTMAWTSLVFFLKCFVLFLSFFLIYYYKTMDRRDFFLFFDYLAGAITF